MPLLAAALFLAFLMLVVLWRAYQSHRKTGDYGLRPPARGRRINQLAVWTIIGSGALHCVSALPAKAGWIGILRPIPDHVRFCLAAVLMILGVAITVAAQIQMGRSWRIGIDESEKLDLITHGLFGYVRNPIYVGVSIFWFGNFVLMPTCISLMTLISGWLGMLLLVRFVEEPFMESKHSLNYSEYASSVGRFVPGLGLIRQDTDPDGIE